MTVEQDLSTIIKELCPNIRNIYPSTEVDIRKPVHGVVVRQRETSGSVKHLLRCDSVFVDLLIKGEGRGEIGIANGWKTASELYKALTLVFNRTVGDTEYIRIYPDSSPFLVPTDDPMDTYVQFGLECVRYYGY